MRAAAPLLGYIAFDDLKTKALAAVGKHSAGNIYTRIGVRPFINARGTWTYLSGSLELPEVRAAKQQAREHFVDIFELQHGVGQRLAELSGAESGMVTSGAAGAMASATAACIAGSDPANIWQLPDTTGLKHEVVMFGGRSAFDSAIRLAGAQTGHGSQRIEELQIAINDNTAMIYTTALGERLEKAVAIAKKHGVPLLLDDAAGIPPIENLKLYAKMGVRSVLLQRRQRAARPAVLRAAAGPQGPDRGGLLNTSPWEGAVCRPMKVGKEEIMGALAAVEAWLQDGFERARTSQWNERVERIAKLVETVPGVSTEIKIPEGGNRYPTSDVKWDEAAWNFTVADCDSELGPASRASRC